MRGGEREEQRNDENLSDSRKGIGGEIRRRLREIAGSDANYSDHKKTERDSRRSAFKKVNCLHSKRILEATMKGLRSKIRKV